MQCSQQAHEEGAIVIHLTEREIEGESDGLTCPRVYKVQILGLCSRVCHLHMKLSLGAPGWLHGLRV